MKRALSLFFALIVLNSCGGVKKSDKKLSTSTTWHWQLQGEINKNYSVKLYDIDLFDTPKETIKELQKSGKIVICYFSAGTYEDWREDASSFPKEALGKKMEGWDERWIDIRDKKVLEIMKARLDLAKDKGCDGVEPDNVDGYSNDTGFNLTWQEQIKYNKFLAIEAKNRGLLIGLKNDLAQIKELEPYFDFALNEQCHKYNECDKLSPFIKNNKPVFNAEYAKKYVDNLNGARDKLCADAKARDIRTLILPRELDDSFRISCDE